MYNRDLTLGLWPGPNVTFSPLIRQTAQPANPIMSMLDANGNILIVATFGVTGAAAPAAPAASDEGTIVDDGSMTWKVVSPSSQGFRIDNLPGSTSPTYQILPYYQIEPPTFTSLAQLIDPIPNSYSRHFYRGLEAECLRASPNPGDEKRGNAAKIDWINGLTAALKQGDRELDIYRATPETGVVEDRWGWSGCHTADRPF